MQWGRGIYRARRRVSGPGRRESVSFAGRSAVLRRGRFGPALLRKAPRCSCRAVACGDRGVSDSDMGRRPLVRRRWRHGCGVLFTARPGCLPSHRDCLDHHDSSGFDQGLALSRRAPRVVRRSREAAALPCGTPLPPVLTGRPHGIASIRPRRLSAAWRIRAHAGASPRRLQNALASRKRHLGVGNQAMVTRAPAGFPPAVWSPSLSEWLPTTATIGQPPKRLQCTAGTKAAPAPRV